MKPQLIIRTLASFFALCGCSASTEAPASASSATAAPAAPAAPAARANQMDDMPPVPATVADWARGSMLFEGLGNVHRPITTSSPQAQKYFDQGLSFMWGF